MEGIRGLYLKAFCSGLDHVLAGYRNKILQLESDILKDPHLSIAHIACQLQQVGLFITTVKIKLISYIELIF